MAAGDELIDHNDRVLVLNRCTDGAIELMYGGVVTTWKARETRSLQRREALEHYVPKSTFSQDPTNIDAALRQLVVVHADGSLDEASAERDATTDPITLAEINEIRKFGILNDRNLAGDRYLAEDGTPQQNRVLLGTPRGVDPVRRAMQPSSVSREAGAVFDAHAAANPSA